MRVILVIGVLFLALLGASAAPAQPPPNVVDGGGGGGPICQWAGFQSYGSNSGGYVTVYFHWCAQNGRIWDNYGYALHTNPCCSPVVTFEGFNPEYSFGSGYTATGVYALHVYAPIAGWVAVAHESVRACIAVNGWGGFSRC